MELWQSIIPALGVLAGVAMGHFLRIGGERKARIEDARREAYADCVSILEESGVVAILGKHAHTDEYVLKEFLDRLTRYNTVLGKAEIYADDGVRKALREVRDQISIFAWRLYDTDNPIEKPGAAWENAIGPHFDEAVAQMRRHLGIK